MERFDVSELTKAASRIWFVTGCSSGLGRALCERLLESGARVVCTARDVNTIADLRQQHGEGFWHAPLEANVSMDAQYIFLNRFMGRSMTRVDRRVVDHMLATQSADGSWPLYAGGPGHLSDTIEAYFALKLAGLSADDAPLRRAREFIRAHGGLAKAGDVPQNTIVSPGVNPANPSEAAGEERPSSALPAAPASAKTTATRSRGGARKAPAKKAPKAPAE